MSRSSALAWAGWFCGPVGLGQQELVRGLGRVGGHGGLEFLDGRGQVLLEEQRPAGLKVGLAGGLGAVAADAAGAALPVVWAGTVEVQQANPAASTITT